MTAGYGLATGNTSLVRPTVSAVAACIAGEVTWTRLLNRRADNALVPLIAENVLLLIVLITWLGTDGRPHGIITLSMLALASAGIGGQSIWTLRIHQTTTYFTGMLTAAVNAAAGGSLAKQVSASGNCARSPLEPRSQAYCSRTYVLPFPRSRVPACPAGRSDHDPGLVPIPWLITVTNPQESTHHDNDE